MGSMSMELERQAIRSMLLLVLTQRTGLSMIPYAATLRATPCAIYHACSRPRMPPFLLRSLECLPGEDIRAVKRPITRSWDQTLHHLHRLAGILVLVVEGKWRRGLGDVTFTTIVLLHGGLDERRLVNADVSDFWVLS